MNTLKTYSVSGKVNKVVNIGDGSFYYNFNISPTVIKGFTERENVNGYSYNQVLLTEEPTYKNCVRAVIRAYISVDDEFDLINTANRALMNLLSEEEADKALNDYNEYLSMVSDIKQKVKEDFSES